MSSVQQKLKFARDLAAEINRIYKHSKTEDQFKLVGSMGIMGYDAIKFIKDDLSDLADRRQKKSEFDDELHQLSGDCLKIAIKAMGKEADIKIARWTDG